MATVKGVEIVIESLRGLNVEVQNEVKKGLQRAILKVDSEATKEAPVDTGYLRNNRKISSKNSGFTRILTYDAEYAAAVHNGVSGTFKYRTKTGKVANRTIRRKPNRYADRGIAKAQPFIDREILASVDKALRVL